MVILHDKFADPPVGLLHCPPAFFPYVFFIHIRHGKRRRFQLHTGYIIFAKVIRHRRIVRPRGYRYVTQMRDLLQIFPSHVIRFAAAVMGQTKPLRQTDKMGQDKFPEHIRIAGYRLLGLQRHPHVLRAYFPRKIRRRQVGRVPLASGTQIRIVIVQGQQPLLFQIIKPFHDPVGHELHHPFDPLRFRHKIAHEIFHAAESHKFIQIIIRPVPLHGKPAVQDIPEGIFRQIHHLLALFPVHRDLGEMHLRKILFIILDGRKHMIGASFLAGIFDLWRNAKAVVGIIPGHIKVFGDHPVVLDHLCRIDVFAQRIFPGSGQGVLTFKHIVRQDLVPAVLRIHEDHRIAALQIVILCPEFFLKLHIFPLRYGSHLFCQSAQHLFIFIRKLQIGLHLRYRRMFVHILFPE